MVILFLNMQKKKKYVISVQLIIIILNCSLLMLPRKSWFMDIYHELLYLNLIIQSYPNKLKSSQGFLFSYSQISGLKIAVGIIFRLALDFSDLKKMTDGNLFSRKASHAVYSHLLCVWVQYGC